MAPRDSLLAMPTSGSITCTLPPSSSRGGGTVTLIETECLSAVEMQIRPHTRSPVEQDSTNTSTTPNSSTVPVPWEPEEEPVLRNPQSEIDNPGRERGATAGVAQGIPAADISSHPCGVQQLPATRQAPRMRGSEGARGQGVADKRAMVMMLEGAEENLPRVPAGPGHVQGARKGEVAPQTLDTKQSTKSVVESTSDSLPPSDSPPTQPLSPPSPGAAGNPTRPSIPRLASSKPTWGGGILGQEKPVEGEVGRGSQRARGAEGREAGAVPAVPPNAGDLVGGALSCSGDSRSEYEEADCGGKTGPGRSEEVAKEAARVQGRPETGDAALAGSFSAKGSTAGSPAPDADVDSAHDDVDASHADVDTAHTHVESRQADMDAQERRTFGSLSALPAQGSPLKSASVLFTPKKATLFGPPASSAELDAKGKAMTGYFHQRPTFGASTSKGKVPGRFKQHSKKVKGPPSSMPAGGKATAARSGSPDLGLLKLPRARISSRLVTMTALRGISGRESKRDGGQSLWKTAASLVAIRTPKAEPTSTTQSKKQGPGHLLAARRPLGKKSGRPRGAARKKSTTSASLGPHGHEQEASTVAGTVAGTVADHVADSAAGVVGRDTAAAAAQSTGTCTADYVGPSGGSSIASTVLPSPAEPAELACSFPEDNGIAQERAAAALFYAASTSESECDNGFEAREDAALRFVPLGLLPPASAKNRRGRFMSWDTRAGGWERGCSPSQRGYLSQGDLFQARPCSSAKGIVQGGSGKKGAKGEQLGELVAGWQARTDSAPVQDASFVCMDQVEEHEQGPVVHMLAVLQEEIARLKSEVVLLSAEKQAQAEELRRAVKEKRGMEDMLRRVEAELQEKKQQIHVARAAPSDAVLSGAYV